MVKLIAIYSQPDDPIAFDQHYRDIHTPLARKMPGLRKIEIDRVKSSPMGLPRYYQVAALYFDDLDALNKIVLYARPRQFLTTSAPLMSLASR